MIAGWLSQPDLAENLVKKGRGEPLPDFVDDIALAEAIGVKAWDLAGLPYWWVRRYELYFAGRNKAQQMQQRKGGK